MEGRAAARPGSPRSLGAGSEQLSPAPTALTPPRRPHPSVHAASVSDNVGGSRPTALRAHFSADEVDRGMRALDPPCGVGSLEQAPATWVPSFASSISCVWWSARAGPAVLVVLLHCLGVRTPPEFSFPAFQPSPRGPFRQRRHDARRCCRLLPCGRPTGAGPGSKEPVVPAASAPLAPWGCPRPVQGRGGCRRRAAPRRAVVGRGWRWLRSPASGVRRR